MCRSGPRSCQLSPFPLPHLVQVLGTRIGPIFFCCFHLSPGSLWFNFLVNTKGVARTPWVYPFVGEQVSSSSSPGEGKPAPEVVTPAPSRLSLSPAPHPACIIVALYCSGGLEATIWHISGKLNLTKGLAQTLWQQTQKRNKRFTVLNRGGGESKQSGGLSSIGLSSLEMHSCWTVFYERYSLKSRGNR